MLTTLKQPAIGFPLSDPEPTIHLSLHIVITLTITAEEACRRVNRQVIPELGTGLIADAPELNLTGEQVTWRVPIMLSLPTLGTLGEVGTVAVDARTGEVLQDVIAQERMVRHARWLYLGATLPTE